MPSGRQQQQPRLRGDLTPMMVFAIFSAVLGMFQFGFNTGVINAPQKVLEEFIANVYKSRTGNWISEELRDLIWSITVSIFAIGGMLGGLMAPTVANWCGRKMGLVLNNSVALVGVLLMSCSQLAFSIECLIIGRFFIGLNCGLNTALVPMYLTEISPVNMRGALGTVSQLGVTIGLLFSQVLGLKDVLGTKELWPILFGFAFVPALLQLIMLPFCPESPRYLLLSCGRLSDARLALRRLRGSSDVESDIEEMRAEDRAHQEEIRKYGKLNSIRELFEHPWLRSPMIIGIMMQLSQQLSGINAIFYYSTDIFLSAELPEAYAVFATLGVGAIMVIMTLISIPMMDRLGRRALHLYGLGGMFLASIFLTISLLLKFLYEWMKYISVISILIFTVFFGIGPGSIPFMITAELFTQGTRPTAMSVSVLFNWLSNFLVGLAFPLMKRMLQSYLFLPFTVFLAIFWIFLYKKLPETKNRTFEEISALFKPIQFNSSSGGDGHATSFTDYGCVSMAGQQAAVNPLDTSNGGGSGGGGNGNQQQGRFRFDSVATESFIGGGGGGGQNQRQADNCLNLRASNQVCPDHCTFSSSPQQQQKQQGTSGRTITKTMARRSSPSRGSAMGRGRSPSPARRAAPPPPPPKAVAPTPAQPTAVGQPAMAAPGGGMMANIASTAAGVAIGHTVGHAITGALGMNGGHSQPEPVAAGDTVAQQPMMQQQQQPYGQQNQEPCKFELEQFLSCAQNQSINDLTLCDGFNQVLRECKMRYGGMYQ